MKPPNSRWRWVDIWWIAAGVGLALLAYAYLSRDATAAPHAPSPPRHSVTMHDVADRSQR